MHACDVYMMIRHEIGLARSLDRLSLARHFVRRKGGRGWTIVDGRTDSRVYVHNYEENKH